MRLLTIPVIACLALIGLHSQEASSQTAVDLMMDVLTNTAPCASTCFFRNFQGIVTAFNKTCMGPIVKNAENLFVSQDTPPSNGPDPGAILRQIGGNEAACTLYEEAAQCVKGITRTYCGDSLLAAIERQFQKGIEYLGCRTPNPRASMFKCWSSQEAIETFTGCFDSIKASHADLIAKIENNDYSVVYKELLAPKPGPTDPPMICTLGNAFKRCYIDQVKGLSLAQCDSTTLQRIENEFNAGLDLINCRQHKRTNDGLTCLSKPALILDEVIPCTTDFDYTNLMKSFITSPEQNGLPIFVPFYACDAVTLIDTCIKQKLQYEPACLNDGWTLTTYLNLTTPSRDFLLNEHCQSLGQTPSNPNGAGTCKNTFADFPYGSPAGTGSDTTTVPPKPTDPSSASSIASISLQLTVSILSLWIIWVLPK